MVGRVAGLVVPVESTLRSLARKAVLWHRNIARIQRGKGSCLLPQNLFQDKTVMRQNVSGRTGEIGADPVDLVRCKQVPDADGSPGGKLTMWP